MSLPIELPHVGESVTEAVIVKWLKKPGDAIQKYDPIVEVTTDKVSMEVPSPASGILTRILASEGDTVPMGAVIAEMDAQGPASSPTSAVPEARRSAPDPARVGQLITGANVGPTGGIFEDTSLKSAPSSHEEISAPGAAGSMSNALSPVVLKLASEHGVDLSSVRGTGLGGRVTRKDVLAAIEGREKSQDLSARGSAAGGDRIVEASPIRKVIASRMSQSFREIPHAWSAIEVDVTGLVACRSANRDAFKARHAIDLSYVAFTLHTVAGSLAANPLLNSSWEDGRIRIRGNINVGIAVASPAGLVVPVVRQADRGSVADLAVRIAPLIDRARAGRLEIDDVQGGTFTLNNTGALGSVWGGAIINHPQAAILTTEAIVRRPAVVLRAGTETIEVRSIMNICLSFDHRIIDGSEAAAFMQDVKRHLEAFQRETSIG